jgi:LemA protein
VASTNFLELQRELSDTEDKIMASRRFFNGGVRELNIKIQQFPNNVFANSLGFAEREFFEVDNLSAIQEPPKAKF